MVLPTPAEALLSLLPAEERRAHPNKTIAFARTIQKLCNQVSVQPARAQRSGAPASARIVSADPRLAQYFLCCVLLAFMNRQLTPRQPV
jgi:hypothetical protein